MILSKSNSDTFNTATIQINGQQLFPHRNAEYFREIMPLKTYQHIPKKHIYLYSFSLFPNQHQPSGSFNFTNVDTAILNLTFNPAVSESKILLEMILICEPD